MDDEKVVFKPMTVSGLASTYDVSWKTMQKWLKTFEKKIGKRTGNLYSPRQVKKIYDLFGNP